MSKISPCPETVIPIYKPPADPEPDDQAQLFDGDMALEEAPDRSHNWVVAATIAVSEKIAKHSFLRASFVTAQGQRIQALEVYCGECRRPYDEVADAECEAKIDNTHLIGGDPGVRAKRNRHEPEGQVVWEQAPRIQRRGIAAVVSGDA